MGLSEITNWNILMMFRALYSPPPTQKKSLFRKMELLIYSVDRGRE